MKSKTEIMKELLFLAKTELQKDGSIGYTMPDTQHHIYIYKEKEPSWPGHEEQEYYVVEPNEVIDGAHEPMDIPYATNTLDPSEVLIGCQWCMEVFDHAREKALKMEVPEEQLPDELTVRLAHEAGWMEAEGQIEIHAWEKLYAAIRDARLEYRNHPSERDPYIIEETIKKILLQRYPSTPGPAKNIDHTKPLLRDRIHNSEIKRMTTNLPDAQKHTLPEQTI